MFGRVANQQSKRRPRRWVEELEFDLGIQRDKTKRVTEEVDSQRLLVNSEGNKAKVAEKVIREIKPKMIFVSSFYSVR